MELCLASFWRGDFIWHEKRLASATADYFYVISSLLFIGIAALHLPWLARSDKVTAQIVSFRFTKFYRCGFSLLFRCASILAIPYILRGPNPICSRDAISPAR